MTRLYRSVSNRKIAGICGGIGEAMNVDPTIIRLVVLVAGVLTGIFPFFIAYLIGWWVIPER
jgi:phage shock protein C